MHRLEKHCYTLSQEYSIAQFLTKCPVQDINACDSPLLPSGAYPCIGLFFVLAGIIFIHSDRVP